MNLLGCELSGDDPKDWLYHEGQVAGARPLYGSDGPVDWRAIFTRRGQVANDCVAHTTCTLIELYSNLHDETPIEFPSPLFLYQRAVRAHRGLFVDEGSQFRYVLKAAREALVVESAWPEKPENIFLVPPADLYTEGLVNGINAFYRIPNALECKLRGLPPPSKQVDDSMRRGIPVASVMKVNRPYARMGARVWEGPLSPDGTETPEDPYWEGYHAQPVIVSADGKKGLGSSWLDPDGNPMGDDGIFWLTDEAFDLYCAEFWCVLAAPLEL